MSEVVSTIKKIIDSEKPTKISEKKNSNKSRFSSQLLFRCIGINRQVFNDMK